MADCSFLVGDVPRRQGQLIFWVSLWLGSLLYSIVSRYFLGVCLGGSVVAVGGEGVRSGDESFWSLNHRSLMSKWFLKRELQWRLIYSFLVCLWIRSISSQKYFNFS
ncbi:predicted protein [Arabidopsis lyrata subsp. lyrata]|uniref:Predicted protein n=1 Tax=Arabidopsis lyrata subsp. lyrata TaxID=81972 RepID=D7LIA5_ARALL|nr:predicted protein [Arabidopsis lyrata subsp. lyrata]